MGQSRIIGEHLLSCLDAVYRVLGESAPTFEVDAYVVCTHDSSRAFGELALELRDYLGDSDVDPLEDVASVLRLAASERSGAMVLYAMVVVVGPRLLVSLLDARAAIEDEALGELLGRASTVVVAQMWAAGEVAKDAGMIEDPAWQATARELVIMAESAGNVESFGISR